MYTRLYIPCATVLHCRHSSSAVPPSLSLPPLTPLPPPHGTCFLVRATTTTTGAAAATTTGAAAATTTTTTITTSITITRKVAAFQGSRYTHLVTHTRVCAHLYARTHTCLSCCVLEDAHIHACTDVCWCWWLWPCVVCSYCCLPVILLATTNKCLSNTYVH